ncbi:calcium:proton antiporter [Brucellaceae bacterium C25G]
MSRFLSSANSVAIIKLFIIWCVTIAFLLVGAIYLGAEMQLSIALLGFLILFSTILAASFGVVHEADELAQQLGEPYGTLILTLSIVLIEVILIVSVLLGPGEAPTIGRDSIFAVMMIIMNLVTGLCLLTGALRHGEQTYNAQGALSYLSMIIVLAGIAFLLPNTFIQNSGMFSGVQAIVIASLTLLIYAAFLYFQMGQYKIHFQQPREGAMSIMRTSAGHVEGQEKATPDIAKNIGHAVRLVAFMVPIVVLSKYLAVIIDYGVATTGAPIALGGLLIAIIVFTPESITAIKAALNNETQRAINLCLGAFVSTVGLTVPAVLTIGLLTGKTVVFGISATETVLFALTVSLSAFSYLGQKTTAVQGLLHLVLFAVFTLTLLTA